MQGQCGGTLVTRGGVRGQARDGRGRLSPSEGGHQVAPGPDTGPMLRQQRSLKPPVNEDVYRQLSQLQVEIERPFLNACLFENSVIRL